MCVSWKHFRTFSEVPGQCEYSWDENKRLNVKRGISASSFKLKTPQTCFNLWLPITSYTGSVRELSNKSGSCKRHEIFIEHGNCCYMCFCRVCVIYDLQDRLQNKLLYKERKQRNEIKSQFKKKQTLEMFFVLKLNDTKCVKIKNKKTKHEGEVSGSLRLQLVFQTWGWELSNAVSWTVT